MPDPSDPFLFGLWLAAWVFQLAAGIAVVALIAWVLFAVAVEGAALVVELAQRRRRDTSADTVARPLSEYEQTGNTLS